MKYIIIQNYIYNLNNLKNIKKYFIAIKPLTTLIFFFINFYFLISYLHKIVKYRLHFRTNYFRLTHKIHLEQNIMLIYADQIIFEQ